MEVSEARYYAHQLQPNWTASSRSDLTETVFFNSANKTNSLGKVTGSFYLSDLITKFRLIANAFDTAGVIGYEVGYFQTQKPLYISFELPTAYTVGDLMDITVNVVNLMKEDVLVAVAGNSSDALVIGMPLALVPVKAESNANVTLFALAKKPAESVKVTLGIVANTSQGLLEDSL